MTNLCHHGTNTSIHCEQCKDEKANLSPIKVYTVNQLEKMIDDELNEVINDLDTDMIVSKVTGTLIKIRKKQYD